MDEKRALVVTTDFFTPVVDDPYTYGLIAAANSLSDIYAMGGDPFLALNIAALPPQLPPEIASEILRGGADKAKEAGVVIAGGHTIQDKEPKYGLIALGFVSLDGMLTKSGLKAGDHLFISKPLGSGVISTALKKELISAEDAEETITWMKRLNMQASKLALQHGARAATDITGFGFLGHTWEMADASRVGLKIHPKEMPFYPQAETLAGKWCFPGGSFDNVEYFAPHIKFAPGITKEMQMLLFDSQTSGGLVFGIPAKNAQACVQQAEKQNLPLWKIGEVTDTGCIEVL